MEVVKFCRWLLAPVMACGLTSCGVDTGQSKIAGCTRSFDASGYVDGVDVYSSTYSLQAVFFNRSIEEIVLSQIDKDLMAEMGLSDTDAADVERYRYLSKAFDLRFLFIEELGDMRLGKDLSVYFFDLAQHEVQPGTEVHLVDMSRYETAAGVAERGDALRAIVDEMRTNGVPDAVMAFAKDRQNEEPWRQLLINLFATDVRFIGEGSARFEGLYDTVGEPLASLSYPVSGVDVMSVVAQGTGSAGEPIRVDGTCVRLVISGTGQQ